MGWNGDCMYCGGKHKESKYVVFNVYSAKNLQKLMKMKWEEIPDWFKLYKYHGFIPYHGNSILDNVDPLAMINDNLSHMKANGFSLSICMCGYCYRRFKKQYKKYEKALITIDYDTMEICSISELN